MKKIPITFCLMTTTKGHFGVKTRYIETLNSFEKEMPFDFYENRIAHIKMTPNEYEAVDSMTKEIANRGFKYLVNEGEWKHGEDSHQTEYIKDLYYIINQVKTPYVFIVEDDWLLSVKNGQFVDYLSKAIKWLEEDAFLMQIRIPRWTNEEERICNLMKKHGLNRWAFSIDNYHFRHDDYSANPSIYRTRDLRAALNLTLNTNLPKHVEHGIGDALKILSGSQTGQFACFNPEKIKIAHIGVLPGEEDPLDKPIYAE